MTVWTQVVGAFHPYLANNGLHAPLSLPLIVRLPSTMARNCICYIRRLMQLEQSAQQFIPHFCNRSKDGNLLFLQRPDLFAFYLLFNQVRNDFPYFGRHLALDCLPLSCGTLHELLDLRCLLVMQLYHTTMRPDPSQTPQFQ